MAIRLPDGSILMADGRIIYANSVIIAADLAELMPLFTPPPAWPFVSGGGGGGGSGSGTPGARGADGAPGAPGVQGPQGTNPGIQGPQGNQGLSGTQGSQGLQGLAGSGAQGFQGFQGFQGNQGNQGLAGSGAQGNQGNQGGNGVQGLQGFQGPQGFQGNQGFQGFQGFQGTNPGVQGPQGLQGFQGADGSQGSNPAASSSVLVRRTTNQINGASPAVLSWESADINNGTMWVIGSPSLITAPVTGYYRAYFCIPVDDGAFGGAISLRMNGVTFLAEQRGTIAATTFGGNAPFLVATWGPFPMTAGDYFEFLTAGLSGAGAHTVVAIGGLNPFAEVERVF